MRGSWRGLLGVTATAVFLVGLATGTPAYAGSASLVDDIQTGPTSSGLYGLAGDGSTVYFAADAGSGNALWKSNGTPGGTSPVADIAAQASAFTPIGGLVYFSNADPTNGFEPWTSDGTGGGTGLLKDVNPGTAY